MMSFEGDEDTLYEFIPYIEETWSVSKDGGKSIQRQHLMIAL